MSIILDKNRGRKRPLNRSIKKKGQLYICQTREIPEEVAAFEPALALEGGADGLDVFRREIEWCRQALRPGGGCAFELHETCLDEAASLARAAGFVDVRIVADLAGRPRVLTARKPEC